MKEVVVQLFSFDELGEEAKARAIEDSRDILTSDGWWSESTLAHWKEELLPEAGYEEAKISFSGFGSQGDGASFTAEVNLTTWFQKEDRAQEYAALIGDPNINAHIFRANHYYVHEHTVDVEVIDEREESEEEELINQLRAEILADARKLAREIYQELEEECEYNESDEAIADVLRANDYYFLENGDFPNV